MKKLLSYLSLFALVMAQAVFAETVNVRCFYTDVTYDAPFMPQPENRQCPKDRCYYDLAWDLELGVAMVNGLEYQLSSSAERIMIVREAVNPVMGGMDKASFSVESSSLLFRSVRHTSPDVTLSLEGQCEAL